VLHKQVNETISIALRDSGINVYMGHNIIDVKFSGSGMIESVEVEMNDSRRAVLEELEGMGSELKSSYHEQDSRRSSTVGGSYGRRSTVKCTTLLCCGQKQCEADVFAAINDSGLVYDGGVVVDEVRLLLMPVNIISFVNRELRITTSSFHCDIQKYDSVSALWIRLFTRWANTRSSLACIESSCHMQS
jgi:hypothetical protein